MRTAVFFLAVLFGSVSAAQDELPVVTFEIPSVGGWVMSPDLQTLIVTSPESGELNFIDTVKGDDPKIVKVPFKPDRIALQGNQLFVSVQGSTLVHALDGKTGKSLRRYKLPGTAILNLACHPQKGPVFASNLDEEIVILDPKSTEAIESSARGMFLAVDPKSGQFLYTGTNRPSKDVIEARRGANDTIQLQFVTVAETAAVLKYELVRDELKLVGGNPNTAIGAGGYLHVSPDGERYAMIAGGGWWSTTNKEIRYDIAVFETADMTTMLGGLKCGGPQVICFHPALNLGVAQGANYDFYVFDTESLVHRSQHNVKPEGQINFWHNLLTFGGKGTRIVTLQGNYLHLFPLELTREERAILTKRFGKLPESKPARNAPKIAANEKSKSVANEKPKSVENEKSKSVEKKSKQSSGKSALNSVVSLVNAPNLELATASSNLVYLSDRTHILKVVPKELEGATVLKRSGDAVREWLPTGQIELASDATVYLALIVNYNGREAIPRETIQTLESEGWKSEDMEIEFGLSEGNEVWKWIVLSRKVNKGLLEIPTAIQLQKPTAAVFLIK